MLLLLLVLVMVLGRQEGVLVEDYLALLDHGYVLSLYVQLRGLLRVQKRPITIISIQFIPKADPDHPTIDL